MDKILYNKLIRKLSHNIKKSINEAVVNFYSLLLFICLLKMVKGFNDELEQESKDNKEWSLYSNSKIADLAYSHINADEEDVFFNLDEMYAAVFEDEFSMQNTRVNPDNLYKITVSLDYLSNELVNGNIMSLYNENGIRHGIEVYFDNKTHSFKWKYID